MLHSDYRVSSCKQVGTPISHIDVQQNACISEYSDIYSLKSNFWIDP